ncbi:MAG: hypothetical protein IJR48_02495 [Oscillibacter sp.]|nr:hypothetical protein [Oscillibacter sp.]MBQ7680993.1 hypothetical protein [Oscillibacter sp.]MBQ9617209.1 hypothetical protein [Oscillibacter sp.]
MFEPNQVPFTNPVRTAQDLEARVEYWHTHETNNTLREFLGISRKEYEVWLTEGDDALLEILSRTIRRVVVEPCKTAS